MGLDLVLLPGSVMSFSFGWCCRCSVRCLETLGDAIYSRADPRAPSLGEVRRARASLLRVGEGTREGIGEFAGRGRRSVRSAARPYDWWMATPGLQGGVGVLVGRERECAAIDRLLEASAGGQ